MCMNAIYCDLGWISIENRRERKTKEKTSKMDTEPKTAECEHNDDVVI